MNPKQEILNMLPQGAIEPEKRKRIRAILETHELVSVDSRPFDPTLCGFESFSDGVWIRSVPGDDDLRLRVLRRASECFHGLSSSIAIFIDSFEPFAARNICDCPWPETQSDGKKLLELLGVLEK